MSAYYECHDVQNIDRNSLNQYDAAMNAYIYLSGDFSGIQKYVLAVKTSGKAQAKRLRARSARVELFERAALWIIKERLGISSEDFSDRVLVIGGGGFQVALPADIDTARLTDISSELRSLVWDETGGELQFSIAWDKDYHEARRKLEYQKRRVGIDMLQNEGAWDPNALSMSSIGEPTEVSGQACQVCGQRKGVDWIPDEDDEEEQGAWHCQSCLSARALGQKLTRPDWMWIRPGARTDQASALGVNFAPTTERHSDAIHAARWIPQNDSREPLTFEELAKKSRGVHRLAVIKADVDDMGKKVGEIVREDSSLTSLREFNRDLGKFFGQEMHGYLKESWQDIYTIYSGGDDLLLVGPWNIVLDFAGELRKRFHAGPGGKHNLTFSAGIALTPYRIPIRHAVERADVLEELAKDKEAGKNRCAALDAVWTWDNHDTALGNGKKLVDWIENYRLPRSIIHRLLSIAEAEDPTGKALRSAHWTYQVSRNADRPQLKDFKDWAMDRADWLARDATREEDLKVLTASLRYAMLSTRIASQEN